MKILYIFFQYITPSHGVSKKVLAQCDGLRANGAEVYLYSLNSENGELLGLINGKPFFSYGKSPWKHFRLLLSFNHLLRFIKENQIDLVYGRFSREMPFSPFLYKGIRKLKVKSFLEMPTYPYDSEGVGNNKWLPYIYISILFKIDKLTRRLFKYYVDKIVTVQDYDNILSVPTLKISNAVDLNTISLRKPVGHAGTNMVAVANLGTWHGYDRLIKGLGLYYKNGGKEDIHFYIIGNGSVTDDYKRIAREFDILYRIHFEGSKNGSEIDPYFDKADIAIGSLGGHRKGIVDAKPLKCVEYAARGIPFIYSEFNSDFDKCPFVLRVLPDDIPIDIDTIIRFYKSLKETPSEIRSFVTKNLTWEIQMNKILSS